LLLPQSKVISSVFREKGRERERRARTEKSRVKKSRTGNDLGLKGLERKEI